MKRNHQIRQKSAQRDKLGSEIEAIKKSIIKQANKALSMSKKIGFLLNPVDGWPPHNVEYLWLEDNGDRYTIKNFPFYTKGVAFEDIITLKLNDDGYAESWKVVTPSGNSLIWVFEHEPTSILERLQKIGCGFETQKAVRLHAVNIPPDTDVDLLDSILDSEKKQQKISVAFPVFRLD